MKSLKIKFEAQKYFGTYFKSSFLASTFWCIKAPKFLFKSRILGGYNGFKILKFDKEIIYFCCVWNTLPFWGHPKSIVRTKYSECQNTIQVHYSAHKVMFGLQHILISNVVQNPNGKFRE